MLKVVNVYLWDTFVGSASAAEGNPFVRFEYSPDIRNLGVEISPYRMPLSGGVYSFPDLSLQSIRLRSWRTPSAEVNDEFAIKIGRVLAV